MDQAFIGLLPSWALPSWAASDGFMPIVRASRPGGLGLRSIGMRASFILFGPLPSGPCTSFSPPHSREKTSGFSLRVESGSLKGGEESLLTGGGVF
ncbi:UNVERIFIED_CONTAM: hypothetical protein Slati_0013600 [Sesamum latifolium]|uniref:Secreted protein n=1 Tax=Sesamum latifolium TaxID=2727402 RepID=A0AAW2Y6C0_9LAMI